jgi:hypothetical protein
MVASVSFAEFLREQLAPLGRVTMRRMFSTHIELGPRDDRFSMPELIRTR